MKKNTRIYHAILTAIACVLTACVPSPGDVTATDELPPIYPDYADVTVPVNIAPLNFMLRDSVEAIYVTVSCGDLEIKSHRRGNEARFGLKLSLIHI